MAVVGLAAKGKLIQILIFREDVMNALQSFAIFGRNVQLDLIVAQNHICHGGFDNT